MTRSKNAVVGVYQDEDYKPHLTCKDVETNTTTTFQITLYQWERLLRWEAGEGTIDEMLWDLSQTERNLIMTGRER